MTKRKTSFARKASWLAFGLAALAMVASAQEQVPDVPAAPVRCPTSILFSDQAHSTSDASLGGAAKTVSTAASHAVPQTSQAAEATRAYELALEAMSALTAYSPLNTRGSSLAPPPSNSLVPSFIPILQSHDPLGSAMRLVATLLPRLLSWLTKAPSLRRDSTQGMVLKVLDLLEHAAALGNADALYTLAHISLFPPARAFPLAPPRAYAAFAAHAARTGNATSQALRAFFHATGFRGAVPPDPARAQLYYAAAAAAGDAGAQMALAFRYWSALPIPGALEDCNRAVGAYERAKGLAFGGAPCGLAFAPTPTRVSGLAGGDRPTMASAAPPEARGGHAAFHASGGAWDDILEYYLFNADRRELEFAYRLAKTSYHGRAPDPSGFGAGAGFVPRDFARARHYFAFVARAVWPEDPLPPFNISPFPPNAAQTQAHALAASSASFLGRMHLRGEGAPADAARAHAWFARGAAQGDARCLNAMGEMWRDGLVPRLGDAEEGGPDAHANTTTPRPKTMAPDPGKAMRYFAAAARQGLPEAQLNLARHHFARGELQAASALFDAVLVRGSGFEAYYYLGQGPDAGPAL